VIKIIRGSDYHVESIINEILKTCELICLHGSGVYNPKTTYEPEFYMIVEFEKREKVS
jgi:hypothetical protein